MSDSPTPDLSPSQAQGALLAIGQSYLRHALGALGAFLITHGFMAQSDDEKFVGAITALVPLAWSAIYHWVQANKQNIAELKTAAQARLLSQLGVHSPAATPTVAAKTAAASAIIVGLLFLPFAVGCGTTAGIAVANILDSSANKALVSEAVSLGVSAGLNSLEAQGNVPPSAASTFNASIASGASTLSSSGLDYIASLLRTKQSTPSAATAAPLTTLLTQAGAPSATASTIANGIQTLAASGVDPDAANEATAVALNAAAAVKAPTQVRRTHVRPDPWSVVLRTPADEAIPPIMDCRTCKAIKAEPIVVLNGQ